MRRRRKSWTRVADEQFRGMPQDFKSDWQDLRDRVYS